MIGPILILDDDADVVHAARLALKPEAGRIDTAASLEGVEDRLATGAYDVVLLDMNFGLGRRDGLPLPGVHESRPRGLRLGPVARRPPREDLHAYPRRLLPRRRL